MVCELHLSHYSSLFIPDMLTSTDDIVKNIASNYFRSNFKASLVGTIQEIDPGERIESLLERVSQERKDESKGLFSGNFNEAPRYPQTRRYSNLSPPKVGDRISANFRKCHQFPNSRARRKVERKNVTREQSREAQVWMLNNLTIIIIR